MYLPPIFQKEHRKPVVLAVVGTLIVWNAFSFGWLGLPNLGFMTTGAAEHLAVAKMEKVAVPLAAQLCAAKFNAQEPGVVTAKSAKLKAATYNQARSDQLEKDWVMLGDSRDANQRVIEACSELILAAPTGKSASLAK